MGALPGTGHTRLKSTAGGKTLIFNWYIKQSNRLHNLRPWTEQHAQLQAPGKQRSTISLSVISLVLILRLIRLFHRDALLLCCLVQLKNGAHRPAQFVGELLFLSGTAAAPEWHLKSPFYGNWLCLLFGFLISARKKFQIASCSSCVCVCVCVCVINMICSSHSN